MEEAAAAKVREGSGGGGGRGDIERLPEDCISRVLSFTSPRDVCRSSAASKAFLSAAESDLVWNRFLPPDYEEILHRSSPPVAFSSKRDLYFRLCDSVLVDDGCKILWLEKSTGKKCNILSARTLGIIWGNDHRYWRWISLPDARLFLIRASSPVLPDLVTILRYLYRRSKWQSIFHHLPAT